MPKGNYPTCDIRNFVSAASRRGRDFQVWAIFFVLEGEDAVKQLSELRGEMLAPNANTIPRRM